MATSRTLHHHYRSAPSSTAQTLSANTPASGVGIRCAAAALTAASEQLRGAIATGTPTLTSLGTPHLQGDRAAAGAVVNRRGGGVEVPVDADKGGGAVARRHFRHALVAAVAGGAASLRGGAGKNARVHRESAGRALKADLGQA